MASKKLNNIKKANLLRLAFFSNYKDMKNIFFFLFLCISLNITAQFKFETGDYDYKKLKNLENKNKQITEKKEYLEDSTFLVNDFRYKLKWNNILTFKQSVGVMKSYYNISYYGYFDTNKKWFFPIHLKFSGSEYFNQHNMRKNCVDWEEHKMTLGLSAFTNLYNDVYFSVGVGVPLGWETYREEIQAKKKSGLLIGFDLEEKIFYLSPNRSGIFLGGGLYQTVITSRKYNFDIGALIEIGVKF